MHELSASNHGAHSSPMTLLLRSLSFSQLGSNERRFAQVSSTPRFYSWLCSAPYIFLTVLFFICAATVNHQRGRILHLTSANALHNQDTSGLHSHVPHTCYTLSSAEVLSSVSSFNSRSFCVYRESGVCVTPRTDKRPTILHLPSIIPNCIPLSPGFLPYSANISDGACDAKANSVRCAHGQFNTTSEIPECPNVTNEMPQGEGREDVDGITIFIPSTPWTDNIYHFAQQTFVLFPLLSSLPKIFPALFIASESIAVPVTLVFRSGDPSARGMWHRGIVSVLKKASFPRRLAVRVQYWFEDEIVGFQRQEHSMPTGWKCATNAIFMGPRTKTFNWPFTSASSRDEWPFYPPRDNRTLHVVRNAVQSDALSLRSSTYRYLQIPTRLPVADTFYSTKRPQCILTDLPGATVLYARRDQREAIINVTTTTRKFTNADEMWFTQMLNSEAQSHGLRTNTVNTHENKTFRAQVDAFRNAGLIIGVHGANLMNAVFAPAFSALVEIANIPLPCYVNGGNAGLGYWNYKPLTVATAQESECEEDDFKCKSNANWRRVKIESEEDRKQLTETVRQAMRYLTRLRERFAKAGAVPVKYTNGRNDIYEVDWDGECGLA